MIAKNTIQKLQDSQLIRIFLDFVQTYHLQYEKINKEISYKCHEATWVLAKTKATGYGRTQSEAYKHALRNLLQILVEDECYAQFFIGIGSQNQSSQKQDKNSKHYELNNAQNKKQQTNSIIATSFTRESENKSTNKFRQHKTQAFDSDFQYNNQIKANLTGSIGSNLGYTKTNAPPVYPTRASLKQKDRQNKSKYETLSISKNQLNNNHSNSASKLGVLCSSSKKNYTEQSHYASNNKRQVYHSKINLNVQSSSSIASTQPKQTKQPEYLSEQLRKAKEKMQHLEQQLSKITEQNNILRLKIESQNSDNKVMASNKPTNKPKNRNLENQIENIKPPERQKKIEIPKLKLQVLPSYHKQSQKSLNDSLLAMYNEKHGIKKII